MQVKTGAEGMEAPIPLSIALRMLQLENVGYQTKETAN
jgi:hypothetical protein